MDQLCRFKDMVMMITEDSNEQPSEESDEVALAVLDTFLITDPLKFWDGEIKDNSIGVNLGDGRGNLLLYVIDIEFTSRASWVPGRWTLYHSDPTYPDQYVDAEYDLKVSGLTIRKKDGVVLYQGPDFTDFLNLETGKNRVEDFLHVQFNERIQKLNEGEYDEPDFQD